MTKLSGSVKIFLFSIVIVVTIVSSFVSSLSLLKEEAIKSHLEISTIHAKSLADQVTQTFNSINILTSNLISLINKEEEIKSLDSKFKEFLFNNPFLRSINILDKNKNVIYSTNSLNKDLMVFTNDFYPKPMFDKSMLRFGLPWIGRDLIDGSNITHMDKIEKGEASFIPVLRFFSLESKEFYILININSDYFLNRYYENLNDVHAVIDIIRTDGILLYSSDKSLSPGISLKNFELLENSIKHSFSTGIERLYGEDYISSYQLTEHFPLAIAIRADLKASLKDWETKTFNISILVTSLILISAILIIALLYKYQKEKEQEIKAQKKQLKQKKKFHALFDQSMFLAAVMKSNGTLLEINQLGLNFVNKTSEEIDNTKFWDLPCWLDRDKRWLKELIENYELDETKHKEVVLLNHEFELRVIEFTLMPLEFENEIELVALGLDITQKKKKESELKQAYTVFENTHDGIMITDEKTNIINVNEAFKKSTGYSIEDVFHKTPKVLQSGQHDKDFYKTMWECIEAYGKWEGELINRRKSGELFNEYITISAVYDDKGKIKNYIGIFSDTTKQKEQEALLKEQQEMLYQQSKMAAMGEMIENIAHQWRQPLSVISTISTSMIFRKEMGLEKPEDEVIDLEKINDSAQYLSQTIEDFRGFMRTNKAKEKFNLNSTVNRSINLLSSKLNNRNIEVKTKTEDIDIVGIENELVQVLLNILNNSRDVLVNKDQDNKVIFINTIKDNKKAVIEIYDNGGGIDESIIDRVFEPYFTTKHKSQGTGIGLYMSEEIIVNHMKGTLKVSNKELIYKDKEYKGACFRITLPVE